MKLVLALLVVFMVCSCKDSTQTTSDGQIAGVSQGVQSQTTVEPSNSVNNPIVTAEATPAATPTPIPTPSAEEVATKELVKAEEKVISREEFTKKEVLSVVENLRYAKNFSKYYFRQEWFSRYIVELVLNGSLSTINPVVIELLGDTNAGVESYYIKLVMNFDPRLDGYFGGALFSFLLREKGFDYDRIMQAYFARIGDGGSGESSVKWFFENKREFKRITSLGEKLFYSRGFTVGDLTPVRKIKNTVCGRISFYENTQAKECGENYKTITDGSVCGFTQKTERVCVPSESDGPRPRDICRNITTNTPNSCLVFDSYKSCDVKKTELNECMLPIVSFDVSGDLITGDSSSVSRIYTSVTGAIYGAENLKRGQSCESFLNLSVEQYVASNEVRNYLMFKTIPLVDAKWREDQ